MEGCLLVWTRIRQLLGRVWNGGKLPLRRVARAVAMLVAAFAAATCGTIVLGTALTPVTRPDAAPVVNDVTGLNPIRVAEVVRPTTTAEIVEAVRTHAGPVSIGGGRYSMGGQTATQQALQLDLRDFDEILAFDSAGRTITVQSGITWRRIQERIDPAGLSVKIMQTYSNFTVGGSLSVNVHGRYIGLGPVVLSVREFRIVLADGSERRASRTENAELFYGAIGGYGGLGVITEVTLELAENVRVKRTDRRMPLGEYAGWFRTHVRDSAGVIFHNADLYPNEYDRVNAVSYTRTDEPLTVPERLIPSDRGYRRNRVGYWVVSTLWGGEELREHLVDPLLFRGEPVSWRNHEASYDVAELEPASREEQTYVLQEYFVPVARLAAFVDSMGRILRAHDANVINVSIRHAMPDPGTLLAWAPEEVFALVVYYKQGTDDESRAEVGRWTRELIDAVLAEGGRYYLPYQLHATDAQFARAYPRSAEFFALKRRLDPTNKFRNALWDRYYLPRVDAAAAVSNDARAVLDTVPGYRRPVSQTYLANPEWYIVYSSEEYAEWMRDRHPTRFPYLRSIGQYWEHWREMRRAVSRKAPSTDYQVMLGVIGVSYTAELMLKGVYENTVGRLSGWTAGGSLSAEDSLAYRVATEYAAFLHDAPWYRYDFVAELGTLWGEVPILGRPFIRKLERRVFLTVEFGVKAVYGALIGWATGATSSSQAAVVGVVVSGAPAAIARAGAHPSVQAVVPLDGVHTLIQVERYRRFREWVVAMAADSVPVTIAEIAGNEEIVVTGEAPAGWRLAPGAAEQMYSIPLPVDATRERVTLRVPVRTLLAELRRVRGEGALVVKHLYDF